MTTRGMLNFALTTSAPQCAARESAAGPVVIAYANGRRSLVEHQGCILNELRFETESPWSYLEDP